VLNTQLLQKDFHYYKEIYTKNNSLRDFSTDLSQGIVAGNQVTYVMLQLLIYMGVKEIYLLGVDFNYSFPNGSNEKEITCKGEINHFHKDYFSKGELWTNPDLENSIRDFEAAQEVANIKGVKIYNATRGGCLEFFPRVSFDQILKE